MCPSELVPEEVLEEVRKNIELLCSEWDRMYPENPVSSIAHDCEDDENEEN